MMGRSALFLAVCLTVASPAVAVEYTGYTGGGQAFGNMQPSVALTEYVQTSGIYPTRDGGLPINGFFGQIRTFAYGTTVFTGAAQGQMLSVAQNTALYSVLGPQFGGDGRQTFALPNLTGTTMVGAGSTPNGYDAFGAAFGSNRSTLSLGQMPAHDHDLPSGGETGFAGGNQPIDNRQASLALTYGIVADGLYGAASENSPAVGQIEAFAGNFAPNGLLAANGQLVSIDEYPALFTLIGTTYGGDGQTNFRLPDLTGRVAVGANAAPDATHAGALLGQQVGADTVQLREANLPSHTHTLPDGTTTDPEGGNAPFTNEQASLGLNWIIDLQGNYPVRGEAMDTDFYLGEVTLYAGTLIPTGWVLAQGQLLPINQYQALFSLLGTTFGGDGRTTFALPDLRGRTVIGSGTGYAIGSVNGTTNVQLTTANLPSHDHSFQPAVAPVPEPATWGMLVMGFAAIGAGLRRRRHAHVALA